MDPLASQALIKHHFLNASKKLALHYQLTPCPMGSKCSCTVQYPCACLWIQPCACMPFTTVFYNNLNQFPTLANPDMSTLVLEEMFQNIKKLKWVLANSFYELEKEVIDSMAHIFPIKPVGPLVPPSLLGQDENEDVGIEMWKPRLVHGMAHPSASFFGYIHCLWKLIVLSAKQMESIANALKKSHHPFFGSSNVQLEQSLCHCHRGLRKRQKTEAWWCHGVHKQRGSGKSDLKKCVGSQTLRSSRKMQLQLKRACKRGGG
ncbi:hypothetical protein SESBI_31924 [Sesbania bispinosa]|nr:hypothetical protein SESBI_31924 [Sesbania bispinosa]